MNINGTTLFIKLKRSSTSIVLPLTRPNSIPPELNENLNKISVASLKSLCDAWTIPRKGLSKISDLQKAIRKQFDHEEDSDSDSSINSDSEEDSSINSDPDPESKQHDQENPPHTFIDLFAGIGGFHQALSNMSYKCVFASEINEPCRKTYHDNYKLTPNGDITTIDATTIPPFDILCAGFPCQPFSKAGHQNGFKDKRGNLFFTICNIVKHHNPKYLILENVKNLASHDSGNTWKTIRKNIKEMGYLTYETPIILNTLYFDIPQCRERVVILCKRKDLGKIPPFPKYPQKKTPTRQLTELLEANPAEKYSISEKFKQSETVWYNFIKILNDNDIPIPKFPIWTDWWDSDGLGTSVVKKNKSKSDDENKKIIKEAQASFYTKYKNWIDKNRTFYQTHYSILHEWIANSREQYPLWKGAVRKLEWQAGNEKINIKDALWSPRGSGIRVKKLDYAPTLVAMSSMIPIYGAQSRYLTPRECARLQSFPDNFKINENDSEAYKQFGNAVNVKMIESCARFLINDSPLFSTQ